MSSFTDEQCQGIIKLDSKRIYPYQICKNKATNKITINNNKSDVIIDGLTKTIKRNKKIKHTVNIDSLFFCEDCYKKYSSRNLNYDNQNLIGYIESRTIDKIYLDDLLYEIQDVNSIKVSKLVREVCDPNNIIEPEFGYIHKDKEFYYCEYDDEDDDEDDDDKESSYSYKNVIYFVYRENVNQYLRKDNHKIKKCIHRDNYDTSKCYCNFEECGYYYLDELEFCNKHPSISDIKAYVNNYLSHLMVNIPNELLHIIAKYTLLDIPLYQHTNACIAHNKIMVFARCYNIFRILSGQNGLSYST